MHGDVPGAGGIARATARPDESENKGAARAVPRARNRIAQQQHERWGGGACRSLYLTGVRPRTASRCRTTRRGEFHLGRPPRTPGTISRRRRPMFCISVTHSNCAQLQSPRSVHRSPVSSSNVKASKTASLCAYFSSFSSLHVN